MKIIKKTILDICKLSNLAYFNQNKMDNAYNIINNKSNNDNINNNDNDSDNDDDNEKCLDLDKCSVLIDCKNSPHLIKSNKRSGEDCQVYTTNYNNSLIFSFRGTESKQDILTDLNIKRIKLPLYNFNVEDQPLVHDGFYDQFITVRDNIDNIIIEYINNDDNIEKNIVFSGHSLGGALATISSLYFGVMYSGIPISCITFGSPRVGCELFANLFNKVVNKSLRFVNDNDPVPCLPSSLRFKHVNECVWMNEDIIKKEINVWRFWRFCKNSFLNIFGYGYFALGDHSCINYVNDIDTLDDKEINKII